MTLRPLKFFHALSVVMKGNRSKDLGRTTILEYSAPIVAAKYNAKVYTGKD